MIELKFKFNGMIFIIAPIFNLLCNTCSLLSHIMDTFVNYQIYTLPKCYKGLTNGGSSKDVGLL